MTNTAYINGQTPRAYVGTRASTPSQCFQYPRSPNTSDSVGYVIGDIWMKTPFSSASDAEMWILVSLLGYVATWVKLVPSAATVTTYTENSGTATPSGGILNVVGTGKVSTGGSGNTITIQLDGSLADEFVTDSGTATPVAGILNVLGGANVSTMGSGDTITITASSGSDLTFVANDASTATSSMGVMNVLGANLITTTSGGGNTFDIKMTNGTDGQVPIGGGSNPLWANITSMDSSVTITNGPNTIDLSAMGGGGSGGVIVTTFTASGTWTPNVNTEFVILAAWNGGAGGASGSKGVGAQAGGGGGAGGNALYLMGPVDYFYNGTGVVVTIGAGGTGGAAQSGTGSGNNGGSSGQTTIGNVSIPVSASSAGLGTGTGGTSGCSSYVLANGYLTIDGTQMGGNSSGNARNLDTASVTSAGAISAFVSPFMCASSGGGGGATGVGGGSSGTISLAGTQVIAGLAGGAAGANGSPGNAAPWTNTYVQEFLTGGTGGSGGGGQSGSSVGSGGAGGIPGGGGGGGGGANTVNSGVGGTGARGQAIFIEFF